MKNQMNQSEDGRREPVQKAGGTASLQPPQSVRTNKLEMLRIQKNRTTFGETNSEKQEFPPSRLQIDNSKPSSPYSNQITPKIPNTAVVYGKQNQGILKNARNFADETDYASQFSASKVTKEITGGNYSQIQPAAQNWKQKRGRTELYNMQKAFTFDQFKTHQIKSLTDWSQNDSKGNRKTLYLKQVTSKNDLILKVEEQTRLERMINYEDRWPLLTSRKSLQKIRIYINLAAYKIIKHKAFEYTSIFVILVNSVTLGGEDPLQVGTTPEQQLVENIFLGLYTFEMVMKIMGLGFIFNKGAYLRDPWNILDFIIVMSAYLTIAQDLTTLIQNGGVEEEVTAENVDQDGLSLNSLRAFRVLRPLRAITSIKGLQVLVLSVLAALPLLQDTILVLLSFFLVFSIAGTQLLSGILKKRCINIETGIKYMEGGEEYLCGGRNVCPNDQYFCGKQNQNPNFGVTNFDNLMFALLVVFQCITLEGWSDIMIYFQQSWTDFAFVLFLPIVFIGAFFLVNLLLAVINSSFKIKNKELQMKIEAENENKRAKKKVVIADEDLNAPDDADQTEIGIQQYWITKRVAHRMIVQLRKVQARKAVEELERRHRPPEQEEEPKAFVVTMPDAYVPPEMVNKNDVQEEDESSQFSEQVYKYLTDLQAPKSGGANTERKASKQVKNYAVNDMRTANEKQKRTDAQSIKRIQTVEGDQLAVKQDRTPPGSVRNTISNDYQNLQQFLGVEGSKNNSSQGEHPFDLSYVHSQIADYPDFSGDDAEILNKNRGVDEKSYDDLSAIASDSSFADKLRPMLVEDSDDEDKIKKPQTAQVKSSGKTIKYLMNQTGGSTQENNNSVTRGAEQIQDDQTEQTLDEKMSVKKKKKGGKQFGNNKVAAFDSATPSDPHDKISMFKKLIRNMESEFIDTNKGKDPYDYINKKTHKIEINPGMPYRSTSMDEVFEIRNQVNEALGAQEDNRFIKAKLPASCNPPDELIQEIIQEYIKPQYDAYQLKTVYQIQLEEEVEFDEDDDDALILALQPFDTVMTVGYGWLLTHKPIKFVARRSDIIVSSTLSITLTPADSVYRPLDKGLLTPEQASIWCDKRHEFRGMNVIIASENFPGPDIRDTIVTPQKSLGRSQMNLLESRASPSPDLLRRTSNVKAYSLEEGKFNVQSVGPRIRLIPPTLLTRPLAPEKLNLLSEEEKRLYQIQKGKYDTYLRILEKKKLTNDHPNDRRFKLTEIDQLLNGKHHEDEVDAEDDEEEDLNTMKYMGRDETFAVQKLENFELEVRKILRTTSQVERPKQDHIPADVRAQLDLPADLEDNQINFNEVISKDCSVKRKTPMWSGQDVLEIGLNNELSEWVISRINAVRVWPKGIPNILKKARVLLKIMVKHTLFDSAMTFAVLLNTIVMGMESYNMDPDLLNFTESANEWFTWIFIGEMASKILAIGPGKYLKDKMNWLDGGVVSISIIELLMAALVGGGGNLSAFKTVRVFRTFRVLRVARLLRALKSMQVILAVVVRSASSFVYITLLLFVFVFIYTLLGMQLFGGQFNFEDGKPRGNFDAFIISFLTVFQVLTTENWNSVLYDSMRQKTLGPFPPVMYYVSWIFIGNFILLNLFLAILLDGFLCEDDEEVGDIEEIERIAKEHRRLSIEKEKKRRLKKLGAAPSKKGLEAQWLTENKEKKKLLDDNVDDIDDLDEQIIREIFMDEGLIKKKDSAREARLMYNGIMCTNSIYIFHKKNLLRLLMYKIYKHKAFDNTIMFLIAISSIKLGADSYLTGYASDSKLVIISDIVDIIMNACFLLELVIKVLAMGLIMDEGSYLRESWNQLDAFIVATSILDMALVNVDLPVIKILRLLRTLRPLRVISHNIAMKLIVASLFESVGAIFNVIVVIVCVWLMFAIFAINIFAGKFFFCSIGKYTYHDKYECNVNGGSWLRFSANFDDIGQAMLTLFGVASLEGWPDVMIAAVDTVDVDVGPTKEFSIFTGFFFVIFILIGSFFLMNFFVGVLFLKYTQAAKNEQKGFTAEHLTWIEIQKMIIEQRCEHSIMNKPDAILHPKRLYYWKIVTSMPFDLGILAIIVLNIVQMGISFENQPILYSSLLDMSNYFFTLIFFIEMVFKMRAFSWRYFETTWNKFDCFIVLSSLVDILLTVMPSESGGDSALSVGPQVARLLRVLRVTRVVRLAKKNKGLQALMATITLSIGPLMNVFALLMLVLFIFSILAVFFFSEVKSGTFMNEYRNYENFGQSFLTLFVIATGENWNGLMYDCLDTPPNCVQGETCGTSLAPIFYIIFVIFVQNIMLNLFILVILTQFEMFYITEDNPINKFKKSLDVFMVTWIHFTQTRYRCLKLREKRLNDFFKELPMPLGLPADTTDDQMKKVMLKMGIRCDDGYVYFNELLYRCMRRQYGSFKLNRKMQIHELKCQYQIYNITVKQQNLSLKQEIYEQFFTKMVGNGKSINPFLMQMYFHISFNTWLNYTRKNAKRERHYLKQEKIRNKCISDAKPFHPEDFQDEKEQLQYVTIEVSELIYYTSEEQDDEESEEEDFKTKSMDSKSQFKRALTTSRKNFQQTNTNRLSTVGSAVSGARQIRLSENFGKEVIGDNNQNIGNKSAKMMVSNNAL